MKYYIFNRKTMIKERKIKTKKNVNYFLTRMEYICSR
jgi:hypothetical protein